MSTRLNSREPRVGMMVTASDVYDALFSQRAQTDPLYVRAVIRSYVDIKVARGKTPYEAGQKLEVLERQMPEHAREFHFIRQSCGLPPSRVLAPPTDALTQILSGHSSRTTRTVSNATTSGARRASAAASSSAGWTPTPGASHSPNPGSPRTSSSTTRTPRPLAQAVEDGTEPPPPPYASQDPDPDSTRILQERLAAEAHARGQDPMAMVEPVPTSGDPPSAAAAETEAWARPGPGSSRPSNEGTQAVYSPPAGPPPSAGPSSSPAVRTTSRPTVRTPTPPARQAERETSPPRRPSDMTDPEEIEAWEQSQLDEATRASMMMEQERLDLEEAMRLSLAEAEAQMVRQSSDDADLYGDGNGNGAGGSGGGAGGGWEVGAGGYGEDERDEAPSKRMSSYHPLQTSGPLMDLSRPMADGPYSPLSGAGPSHRRTVSEGVNHMMPGSWNASASGVPNSSSQATSSHPDQSIIDMLSAIDFNQPINNGGTLPQPMAATPLTPLAVQPTTPSAGVARPGAHTMQSKNPFLSPQEREELEAQESQSVDVDDEGVQPRDQPGSSYTTSTFISSPSYPSGPMSMPMPIPPTPPVPSMSPQQPTTPLSRRELPPTPDGAVNNISMLTIASEKPLPMSPGLTPPIVPARPMSSSPGSGYGMLPVTSSGVAPMHVQGGEDPLEILAEYDTVFLVDDSTSMAGERWATAKRAIMDVAQQADRYSDDGIDIHFINSKRVGKGLKGADDVEELFAGLEPRGSTPTGLRLEAILREYMARLERAPGQVKSMNLIVVTDGVFARPISARIRAHPMSDRYASLATAPTDDPEGVLVACAKRLDRGDFPLTQVGVQLLQVGDDAEAREALQELDDGLAAAHGVRDMVDTVPYNGEEMSAALIVKVLLGGINRRLDRRQ